MSQFLIDTHHRLIDYLRVSITDLCNLRCVYCRPPEGVRLLSHDEILRYEEILTLVGVARDMGIRKIRVTGGEPLVRRGVLDFLSRLAHLQGIEDLGLTTNGVLLASMARDLKAAGLKRLNVSLDTLRRETFKAITGSDRLEDVLSGIRLAQDLGFKPVKINVVLLKGVNEQDVPAFGRLTLESPVDVRFIERMPFGQDPSLRAPDPFSATEALDMIRAEVGELIPVDRDPLDGPASMFTLKGAKGRVGIIDPITGHFCGYVQSTEVDRARSVETLLARAPRDRRQDGLAARRFKGRTVGNHQTRGGCQTRRPSIRRSRRRGGDAPHRRVEIPDAVTIESGGPEPPRWKFLLP